MAVAFKGLDSQGVVYYPKVWKLLGDEILFTLDISPQFRYREALDTLTMVAREYNNKDDGKFRVKLTCWLGHFPFIDQEVSLRSSEFATYGDDYIDNIGPSIDRGFRLKEHSTPLKTVIAADIVWLLVREFQHDDATRQRIYFDGFQQLKGTLPPNYPVFWVPTDEPPPIYQSLNPTELLGVLETFLDNEGEKTKRVLAPGYLRADGKLPEWARKELEILERAPVGLDQGPDSADRGRRQQTALQLVRERLMGTIADLQTDVEKKDEK